MNDKTFLIIVAKGRYDMYAAPTFRNNLIANLIKKNGGISDTVVDGTYSMTMKVKKLKLTLDMQPIDSV